MKYVSNLFEELFYPIEKPIMNFEKSAYYIFFYYMPSPRGNAKVGITTVPWQRLRMYQQGTDELLQMTNLWLFRTTSVFGIKKLDEAVKHDLKSICLHNITKRAGHTEWYLGLTASDYENTLKSNIATFNEWHPMEIKSVPLPNPYCATSSTGCPLKVPNPKTWDLDHFYKEFWTELK